MQKNLAALGVREEVWRTNFERVGYVGSVAVPIMLDDLVREGRLRAGITKTGGIDALRHSFATRVLKAGVC